MAELHFNNDHNKVAYLLKPTKSLGFHQIIEFMNGLYIRYALTANPTIYASVVRQFWGLASEVSLPDGARGLLATIDGTAYTVTEASIRSALQLDDLNAIDTMTNKEIFAGLRDIGPSEPVLEIITSHFRDVDTGCGSFHESPPHPHPATPTISPTRIATLKAKLKATKILHRDTVVLFAKRIKKLESKLKTKKRKLVLSDSENEEEERQSKELDALLDLATTAHHEPTRARATTIIYKRPKKKKLPSGLDFTDADILAGGLVFAGGFAGILVAAGPTILAEPSSPLRDPSKGKAITTPFSPVIAPTDKELADQQAAILEAERQELLEQELKQNIDSEQSTQRQAELDRVALNLTNEEWIGLVDQVRANPTLFAELLGADVSEDTISVRMDVRGLTDDQLWIVYDKIRRAVDLTTAKSQHQQLKRSGETLESSESNKLKSSHSTTQQTELQETTSISACVPIAAGDPISADVSVFVGSSILAATPIAADVSTTAGASGSASEASVPVIKLLDSPPKDTSLPLDPETEELDEPLRKSSRKKSIARKRTLPSPSKPKSDAFPFDEDDPEATFKRADLMVLYGLVLDKYKTERATRIVLETEAGDIMYMFVDKKYPLTPETLQRMLNHGLEIDRDLSANDLTTAIQFNKAKQRGIKDDHGASSSTFMIIKLDNKQVTIQFREGLLGIVIPSARVFCFCWQVFIPAGDLFLLVVLHYCCFDILSKSLSCSLTCKSILPPWKQTRKIYYWDLTPPIDCRDDIPENEMPPRKRLCLSTLGSKEVGYGIRDTWIDPAETVPELAPMTIGEVNTRVIELAELHEHDTHDLYALLDDAQDRRTHISQRVTVDSQRVDLLMEDRITHQKTIQIVEDEAYVVREAWAHSIGLSQAVHSKLQTHQEHVDSSSDGRHETKDGRHAYRVVSTTWAAEESWIARRGC
uniref:Xylulose kinase-1 n=1 Tax=Tanacetum cinerariifolium TaxID=118510 RepID=A0A6L2M847_TANCI|nr:xylulose kinase-1 [Tanacetum cinerariifolium]